MNDVCFDLNGLQFAVDDAGKIENGVKNCTYDFEKMYQKAEGELSSFNSEGAKAVNRVRDCIAEVSDEIRDIESRKSQANSKKQSEKPMPPKPSVPSNATPEQQKSIMSNYYDKVAKVEQENERIRKENDRIDKYIAKCDEAIHKLNELIEKLQRVGESVKSEINRAVTKAHEFFGKAHSVISDNSRINSAVSEFSYAMTSTYESAMELFEFESSKVPYYDFIGRQFTLKNTHTSIKVTSPFQASSFSRDDEREETTVKTADKKEEVLIRDREESAFFEKANNSERIKMPSANLHKLGGKCFMEKMKSLGYELVLQSDGATVDINGMLHWEKKDV